MITHPKVFGIATGDIARANKLLDKVILLDRLPAKQSLPGLKLLRECWDEHDITMHLASRYKLASYVMYILLLVLGVVIIVFVSVQTRANAYYDIEQVSAVLADANLTEATEVRFTALPPRALGLGFGSVGLRVRVIVNVRIRVRARVRVSVACIRTHSLGS